MAITAASYAVVLTADTKAASDGMKKIGDEAKDASGNAGGFLSTLAGFAGANVLVTAASDAFGFLKDQLVDSVKSGADANNALAAIKAHLQSTRDASGLTAQSIDDLASHLSNMTGISHTAVESGQGMLLTFTNIGKSVFPQATQALADMATTMNNGALPSAQQMQQQAIQLGKALNDPEKGLTALQRVGVTFTQQQKDQIKAMQDSGNMAGAQSVILKELNTEFGNSAVAAGQANGGLAIVTTQLSNMKEQIGQALIPVMGNLLKAFAPILEQLQAALPGAIKAVTGFISGSLLPAINNFSDWIKTDGVPDIQKLGAYFQQNLLPPIQQVAAFISGTLAPAVKDIAQKIGDFFGFLATHEGAMNAFKAVLIGVAGAIAGALVSSFVAWAVAAGAAAIATIAATWPILAVGAGVALLIAGIIELVKHWGDIANFFGNIKAAIGSFFSNLGGMVTDLIGHFTDMGKNIIQGLINGVKSMLGNATKAIADVGNSMLGAVKGLFGIASPSKVFAEIGGNLAQGLIGGLQSVDVAGAIGQHLSGIAPQLSASLGVNASVTSSQNLAGLAGAGLAQSIAAQAAIGAASAGGAAGGYAPGTPINIHIAGHRVAQILLPDMAQAIRQGTGLREH